MATNEWQIIQDGQNVPSGLHYRMNLETGKKEAKILDGDVKTGEINLIYLLRSLIFLES